MPSARATMRSDVTPGPPALLRPAQRQELTATDAWLWTARRLDQDILVRHRQRRGPAVKALLHFPLRITSCAAVNTPSVSAAGLAHINGAVPYECHEPRFASSRRSRITVSQLAGMPLPVFWYSEPRICGAGFCKLRRTFTYPGRCPRDRRAARRCGWRLLNGEVVRHGKWIRAIGARHEFARKMNHVVPRRQRL